MLTDRELQSLRNMGNEGDAAADEIERLHAESAKRLAVIKAFRDAGPNGATNFEGWHQAYAKPVEMAHAVLAEADSNLQSTGTTP